MPVFEYKALDEAGKTTSGILDADSPNTAKQKLRSMNMYPILIKEAKDASLSAKKELKDYSVNQLFLRIKPSDVFIMTRQLSTLVGAGFPLVNALATLISQVSSKSFKEILAQIKDSIVEGSSFAHALSLYPKIFSQVYINMVRAGETSGTLEIVLERLADIGEKQQNLINKIRSAMVYPVLMGFIGSVVLFVLLTFIVPNIVSIFSDMNQVLPGPTIFLIGLSSFLKSFWWIILLIIIGIVVFIYNIKKTVKGRFIIDNILFKIPLIGSLLKKLAIARFARTLGSLLENGVSMLFSLEIVKNLVGNVLISDAIAKTTVEVERGYGLGVSLAATKMFPDLSTQMIQVGEQSGKLEAMLKKIADVYDGEVESTILNITSLLEPVMILIMGVVVGFIVLAICLPIFEMNQLIR